MFSTVNYVLPFHWMHIFFISGLFLDDVTVTDPPPLRTPLWGGSGAPRVPIF